MLLLIIVLFSDNITSVRIIFYTFVTILSYKRMKNFYLNKDFFDYFKGASYPLGKDFFIRIGVCQVKPDGYKKFYLYPVNFEVKVDHEFIPVFVGVVKLTNRSIQLIKLHYLLDSELAKSTLTYFPCSPAWLIPCTRFSIWLHRCFISLQVYRDSDWL